MKPKSNDDKLFYSVLILITVVVFTWSVINPKSYFEWFGLALPAICYILGALILYPKFKFSKLVYVLIVIHICVLLIGAKYTYTLNPLFVSLKELLNHSRCHYDRVGHFFQGFVPVLILREVFIRTGVIKKGKFFSLTLIVYVLAFSALWELLEFLVTYLIGSNPDYVIDSQGDIWDTHWDMIWAIIGAVTSLIVLHKPHDKQLRKLKNEFRV